jgi:hypothetical protein
VAIVLWEEFKMSPRANLSRIRTINTKSANTKLRRITDESFRAPDPREFPIASSLPVLPVSIRDEVVDLYAFLYSQRGFSQLGLTFEQFLLVINALMPGELSGDN